MFRGRRCPLIISVAMLAACDSAPSAHADPSGQPAVWSLGSEPLLEIGVVAGEEPYQLHRVRAGELLPDGRIVVADGGSHQVRVFDTEGRFLFASGEEGDGPGQWRKLSGLVHLGGDSLAVHDDRLRRTGFLSVEDGAWLGEADPERAAALRGPVAFYSGLLIEGVEPDRLGILAPVLDRVGAFAPDRPFRVVVEPDGTVLVFPASPRSGPRTVQVLDLGGRQQATLALPPHVTPLRLTHDRLLGVRRDPLDVEFVQVFSMNGREPARGPSLAAAMAARGDSVLASTAIPPADVPWTRPVVMAVASSQEIHYSQHYTYTDDMERLRSTGRPMEIPADVEIQILEADETGWMGRFLDRDAGVGCFLAYGAFRLPPDLRPGEVVCWRG